LGCLKWRFNHWGVKLALRFKDFPPLSMMVPSRFMTSFDSPTLTLNSLPTSMCFISSQNSTLIQPHPHLSYFSK